MPCRAKVVVVFIALTPCHRRSETKNRLAANKQTDRLQYIVRIFRHQKSPRCERAMVVDGLPACFLPGIGRLLARRIDRRNKCSLSTERPEDVSFMLAHVDPALHANLLGA